MEKLQSREFASLYLVTVLRTYIRACMCANEQQHSILLRGIQEVCERGMKKDDEDGGEEEEIIRGLPFSLSAFSLLYIKYMYVVYTSFFFFFKVWPPTLLMSNPLVSSLISTQTHKLFFFFSPFILYNIEYSRLVCAYTHIFSPSLFNCLSSFLS